MRKIFKITVRLKNCDLVLKEELDPGVIGYYELVYKEKEKDLNSPLLYRDLDEQVEKLVSELIETDVEEVK